MLERISEIQGIGLLHEANGKPFACNKVTLIYGDNGRGKSTLATILRSVSTGDATLISHRRTLDGQLVPKVDLQFGSGHKVSFINNAWSERRPEILVFDADFIERNVHSGGAVNTNHRKNLLEFALGEPAVAARKLVEKTTFDAKAVTEEVEAITAQLSGYHTGLTVAQFEKLEAVDDLEKQLAELQSQLVAAGNTAVISAKAVPVSIPEPNLDISGIFSVLNTSLENLHVGAEQIVKEHLVRLANEKAEDWLNTGLQFGTKNQCPFCDQVTNDNDLIKAYQTHFNLAYRDLKTKVASLQDTISATTFSTVINNIEHLTSVATAQASAWAEHVETVPITFDSKSAAVALEELHDFILTLARQKEGSLADQIGTTEDFAKAQALWDAVLASVKRTNAAIKEASDSIATYKAKLETVSTTTIQQAIQRLQATKHRHEQPAIDLIAKLAQAKQRQELADNAKKVEREKLDNLMVQILAKYEKSINILLSKFGASFTIKGMGANFRGNAPRTEYGLLLRGKSVALEGGPPSFTTALSEGDKRTLAFAFFVASTLADAKLATRTVVIDDPMCSLDINRRQHTKTVLRDIQATASQIIVMAHDPYFLRDLRDAFLRADKSTPISIFQLGLAAGDYSSFSSCEIDKVCESAYFQHHRLLNCFRNGEPCDHRATAKAVRPMLEGYLHRRFPGLISKGLLFGEVIAQIRQATIPSPLVHAQTLVSELNEINEYVGQFHHDTNPGGYDSIPVVASELKTFVIRALHVVHRGEPLV